MKLKFKNEHCVIIEFDESKEALRQQGWLGDEVEARIFNPIGNWQTNYLNNEVRIFKSNGESYVLSKESEDRMIKMKLNKIFTFANNN